MQDCAGVTAAPPGMSQAHGDNVPTETPGGERSALSLSSKEKEGPDTVSLIHMP